MESKDYFSFVHVTDLHLISNYNFITNKRFRTFVKDFLPELQPDCVVATGDLSNSIGLREHALPNEDEWKLYKSYICFFKYPSYANTLKEGNYFAPEKWLDIRGNHDAWNHTDSVKEYYKKYSVYGYYNRGSIYQQTYEYKNYRIRFIAIDAANAPFKTFAGTIHQQQLDILEELFKQNNEYFCNILLCHYPLFTMDNRIRSTTGLSFYDLIHIYRPTLFLNGHMHSMLGKYASIRHSCNTYELQTPQFKISGLFRVFTIRNDRIFWNTYSIRQYGKKPFVFVCNPQNCITIDTPISHEFNRLPTELFIYGVYQREIQTIQLNINKKKINPSSVLHLSPYYTLFKFDQHTIDSSSLPYYLRPSVIYQPSSTSLFHNLLKKDSTNSEERQKKFRRYRQKHEDNTITIYSPPFTLYKCYMYFYTFFARLFMHINISIFINKLPYLLALFFMAIYAGSYFYSKSVLNHFQSIRFNDGTPILYIYDVYHVYNRIISKLHEYLDLYFPTVISQWVQTLSNSIPSYFPSLKTRYQKYFDLYYSFPSLPPLLRYIVSKWLLIASDDYIFLTLIIGIFTYLFCPQRIIRANGETYWTTIWGFTHLKTNKYYPCLDHPTFSTIWFILQNIFVVLYLFLFYAIPIPHYMNQYLLILVRSAIKILFFFFMLFMSSYGKIFRSLIEAPEFFFSFTDDIRPTLFFIIMLREVIMA